MTTTLRTASTRSAARQARHRDLQAMLHDRQREMEDVLRHRVRYLPLERPTGGLDETEHAEADIQEHIEVALIQMKGETLRRVQEALVRLDAGDTATAPSAAARLRRGGCGRSRLPFAARPAKNRTNSRRQTRGGLRRLRASR